MNDNNLVSWHQLILEEMQQHEDSFDNVEFTTLTDAELNEKFYDGYGGIEGKAFTLWTKNRVYFPVCYDGAEWAKSCPRNPCNEKMEHQGGG